MTAETTNRATSDETGFQLQAGHLPGLILLAFDAEPRMWAAAGGGLRAHGWTEQDFIGLTLPEIAGSSQAEAIRACSLAALAGECTEHGFSGYEDPNRRWSLTFVPLADPSGAVSGGMALCRDITEQAGAEQLLRSSQRQLAEAQRIAQAGSWDWDLDTDELAMSDELGRMQTDPAPFAFEHRIVRADGAVRTVLARGEGVLDADGRVVRFIGTGQDITDRRQADAERRRLLNRVYEAQEGQDRRLAADLHDGHVQSLAAIGFKLERARLRLGASGSPEVDELLWQVTKDLSAEVTSLRRTIGRLRPLVLVEDGLEAALFRVAQQALANVVDHAAATYALVAIECSQNGVVLRVSDDGCGFGGGTVVEPKLPLTDPTEGWGA